MKSLITGITGFVGSHLAEYLLLKKVNVYGIYRWRSPLKNIQPFENQLSLYEADLRDLPSLISVMGEIRPDNIYHLAAQTYVPAGFSEPQSTFETNTLGTLNLLEAAKILKLKTRFLVCSTADVYGEIRKNESPISESNNVRPVSQYAVSKVACELLAYQYFRSYGIESVITRAFNHTGPRRSAVFAESSFAKQIAEIEKGLRKPVLSVGNLNSVRTFADARDIVKAYFLCMQLGRAGEIYNIAGNDTVTIKRILHELIRMSSVSSKITVRIDKSLLRSADAVSKTPDDSKFRKLTRWKPKIPLEKTLEDLLNFWRSNS